MGVPKTEATPVGKFRRRSPHATAPNLPWKCNSKQQLVFADRQKAQALKERNWEFKQRDATAAFFVDLQRMLNFNEMAVKAAIAANAEAARQIAKIQKEAAEEIDRRTGSMARYSGTGAN